MQGSILSYPKRKNGEILPAISFGVSPQLRNAKTTKQNCIYSAQTSTSTKPCEFIGRRTHNNNKSLVKRIIKTVRAPNMMLRDMDMTSLSTWSGNDYVKPTPPPSYLQAQDYVLMHSLATSPRKEKCACVKWKRK